MSNQLSRASTILLEESAKIGNPLARQKAISLLQLGNITDPLSKDLLERVQSRLADEGIDVQIVTEH